MSTVKKAVFVIGTTGAGKTKLSLDIARLFGGEIINADAIQVYKGLDVASAKVTAAERGDIPHHMLDIIDPRTPSPDIPTGPDGRYDVMCYRNMTLPIMDAVAARERLPVVVGGTNYYVEALLYPSLSDDVGPLAPVSDDGQGHTSLGDMDIDALDAAAAYAQLERIDPVMAAKLHPNQVRKVKRSLEIFRETGHPQSDVIRQQQLEQRKPRFDACLLWVSADWAVLDQRLDARVDDMVNQGMLDELWNFRDMLLASDNYSQGIVSAIGLKEFAPYIRERSRLENGEAEVDADAVEKVLQECLVKHKYATKQYARKQVRWIRNRFLRRQADGGTPVYQLDSTDPSLWAERVLQPASEIVRALLAGTGMPPATQPPDTGAPTEWRKYTCEMCSKTLNGHKEWENHLSSRLHRRHKRAAEADADGGEGARVKRRRVEASAAAAADDGVDAEEHDEHAIELVGGASPSRGCDSNAPER